MPPWISFFYFMVIAGPLLYFLFPFLPIRHQQKKNSPVILPQSLRSVRSFFLKRDEFLNHGFHLTKQPLYQFKLLKHSVMVVSGESARKEFFAARGFDLHEGFRFLSGALPFVQGITYDLRQRRIAQIYKRLATVQKSDRLTELIPEILEDARRITDSWGNGGSFDPFQKIYELFFQTIIRCLTGTEIADDPTTVARLRDFYDDVDKGTTPATVLFPWFPSLAMIKKFRATKGIYDIVVSAIALRKESGKRHNDSLQMLLDAGDEPKMIVGFIMGLLIAGARSTGSMASWMIVFLGCHPLWKERALTEVQSLLSQHSSPGDCSPSPHPVSHSSRLSDVPLDIWESSAPILDSLIRETLRIAQPHVAMRRNIGEDIYLDGKCLPNGTFAIYPFSDVHLDPTLYPDPLKFDPARPEVEGLGYIGWGGGRITCLGTRLAKLEMKIITAMILLKFNFETVDGTGKMANPHPLPNWNGGLSCRPQNGNYFVTYERTA